MNQRFITPREVCAYLPDRRSRTEYEFAGRLTPEEYEARMNAGWRKFGTLMFHPVCETCRECRPIRIPVATFTPDRSQRRTLKRNADLTVTFARPTVDAERLDLYRRYHASQTTRKGWPSQRKTARDYASSFLLNPIPAVEIAIRENDVLRAVALTEVTPNVVSGIYHYHDPACADRGLGTLALLQTIELARHLEKPYAYFGYYVAGCGSLSYKARFQPCEIMGDDGVWRAEMPAEGKEPPV